MNERRFYLGPGRPMTWLRNWHDIVTAAEGDLLGERQWVELKQLLAPSNSNVNLELARDLASLSVDGGLLIFGVSDSRQVTGCDPTGMTSRISQVAASRITPPLSPVIHDPIAHPNAANQAVLIVEIPASADAPHMVDGKYWGRSADGKRTLSDPEVRRLMAERSSNTNEFTQRLEALVDEDPLAQLVEGHPTGQGHTYLLAEPTTPIASHTELDLRQVLSRLPSQVTGSWPHHLRTCSYAAHDPNGTALVNSTNGVQARDERFLTYVSVKDDDSLVVVDGGATARWNRPDGDEIENVLANRVALITLQAMQTLGEITLNEWGYAGQWRVGVHVTELQNKSAGGRGYVFGRPEVPFARASYTRVITTSPATWTDQGMAAADQLLRGFFRGLGMPDWGYQDVLTYG